MKIGLKLILGFFIITMLVWAIGLAGYLMSQRVSHAFDTTIKYTSPALFALTSIQANAFEMQKQGYGFELIQPGNLQLADMNGINAYNEKIDYWLNEYSSVAPSGQDMEFIDKLKESKAGLHDAVIAMANAKKQGMAMETIRDLSRKVEEKSNEFNGIITRAIGRKQQEFREQYESAASSSQELAFAIINLSAFAVVLAVGLGIIISLSLTKPLKQLKENIEDISIGSVDFEVKGKKRKDEIGDVARALDTIASSLKMMIKKEVGQKINMPAASRTKKN